MTLTWRRPPTRPCRASSATAGQDCTARSRILVQRGAYEEFTARFVERTKRLKVGNPLDKATDVGAIISPLQKERGPAITCALARKRRRRPLTGGRHSR